MGEEAALEVASGGTVASWRPVERAARAPKAEVGVMKALGTPVTCPKLPSTEARRVSEMAGLVSAEVSVTPVVVALLPLEERPA